MNAAVAFTPNLRQLRAFRAVYQLRKLSAAAEQLALTQSAVSVLIRQLEDGLGTRLFDRTTRTLRPTAAATEALAVVERILRDVDALGAGLRELGTLRRGRVSVAVTPTLGEILLPRVLQRFGKQHPGIQVVIDDCSPDQFVARVVGEQVDLGLGTPERAGDPVPIRLQPTDALDDAMLHTEVLASLTVSIAARDSLLVPTASVITSGTDGAYVLKLMSDGRFHEIRVTETGRMGGRSAITAGSSDDLAVGDTVKVR